MGKPEQAARRSIAPHMWVVEAAEARPSDAVLAERSRRLSVLYHSLTAAVFGDPRPGYSALDGKTGRVI